MIVAAREQRPTWGPLRLQPCLMSIDPGVQFPTVRAIADIIHRYGLTCCAAVDRNAWACRARARGRRARRPPPRHAAIESRDAGADWVSGVIGEGIVTDQRLCLD